MDNAKIIKLVSGFIAAWGLLAVMLTGTMTSWVMLVGGGYVFLTGDYKFVRVRAKISEMIDAQKNKSSQK